MRLTELQVHFAELLEGGIDIPGIFASGPVPIGRALEVHRATIGNGFMRVLALGYPTVEALVGAGFFERMALDYHDTPSLRMDAALADYGKAFPGFAAGYAPVQSLPYLADVARLDRAVDHCQGAEAANERFVIDETVSLELPRSLRLLALAFPAVEIRAAIFDGDDGALGKLDITPRRRAAAVWRSGRSVVVSPMAPSAMRFLATLKAGATPDAALAAAAGEQPADVLTTLQTDVFAAAFARVRPSHEKVIP
ncbi:MAG: putative DNA-binding domain-containing protein [Sphingomonas sp.]|jgi:hypothetical protein|uniref:HvfC/BufC family peptide modification chaperone n=1 Tax=Sphingomonas sp. TaxID=28214 RepID=UPI0035667A8D